MGAFFWDDIPKESWSHVASNIVYPVTCIVLLSLPESFPAMALALSIPGIVSTLYHTYLCVGSRVSMANVLMAADQLAIVMGIILGVLLNTPVPPPTSATVGCLVVVAFYWAWVYFFAEENRVAHGIWHAVSCVPLLVYCLVDLSGNQRDHPVEVQTAAIILTVFSATETLVCTLYVYFKTVRGNYVQYGSLAVGSLSLPESLLYF